MRYLPHDEAPPGRHVSALRISRRTRPALRYSRTYSNRACPLKTCKTSPATPICAQRDFTIRRQRKFRRNIVERISMKTEVQ